MIKHIIAKTHNAFVRFAKAAYEAPDPIKERAMTYFSEEYRTKLINEHKLVSASVNRLIERYRFFAADHGPDSCTAALTQLRGEKVSLEAKIDVLTEFLEN